MEILREKGKDGMDISKSETLTIKKLKYLEWEQKKESRAACDQSSHQTNYTHLDFDLKVCFLLFKVIYSFHDDKEFGGSRSAFCCCPYHLLDPRSPDFRFHLSLFCFFTF